MTSKVESESAVENALGRSRSATDWSVWLPKAFFLKWAYSNDWGNNIHDSTILLPRIFSTGRTRENCK